MTMKALDFGKVFDLTQGLWDGVVLLHLDISKLFLEFQLQLGFDYLSIPNYVHILIQDHDLGLVLVLFHILDF